METEAKRSWIGRNWLWVLPVGCLAPLLVCGGFIATIVWGVFGVIKSSAPYTESLEMARGSAEAQEALGSPIEPGTAVSGNINVSNETGEADLSYSVTGPKGSGEVRVVATKNGPEWTYESVMLRVDASGQTIDLTPGGKADSNAQNQQ